MVLHKLNLVPDPLVSPMLFWAKKPRTEKTQDIASSRPPRRLAALKQSENLKELLGQQEAYSRRQDSRQSVDDDDEDG